MRSEFEKLAAAGKIEGRHVEPLTILAESGCCTHRSWGFGKIKTVDTVFARFTIDFAGKPGHTMDLAFAAETLKPIPKDHILARKTNDLEGVRQLAAHHLDLIKLVLNSYGGRATADQIQQVLLPDVIRDDWKKWWETAKREMKKDGHFVVPLKKNEPVVFQAQETSLQDRLLADFRAAKGLKARVAVVAEVFKAVSDLTDKAAAAGEIIAALNADIASHQRTQTAVALEAVFARDELRAVAGLPPAAEEITDAQIWLQDGIKFGQVLEQIPAAKHHRALESFKASSPDRWQEMVRGALNAASAKLCRELASLLIQGGKMDLLKETLARLISQHTAGSELLLWLGRDRNDSFADILGPEVFRAMLTAMERDQFNEKRSNRLREFILDDQALLGELTASADIEVIKDLTRALAAFDRVRRHGQALAARAARQGASRHPGAHHRRADQAGHLAARFVGKPGAPPHRVSGTGAEKNPGQLEGNRHRPELRRLERKPRIQGRQGNAENPHAAKTGAGRRSSCARAARIFPTPRPTPSASAASCWPLTSARTSRRRSRFWARGIPTRTRASSATFRPSARRC